VEQSQNTPAISQPEAERAVLASILIDPDCFLEVRGIISAADFFDDVNAGIFRAMETLGDGIDQLTISARATAPPGYLSGIITECPTSAHAAYYAQAVADAAYRRRVIEVTGKLAQLAYEHKGGQQDLYSKVYDLLAKVQPREKSDLVGPMEHADLLSKHANRDRKAESMVSFGYGNLDVWTGGMHPGNLVIIGARPGSGKSQLEQEIATFNADRGKVVLVASAEMSLEEWDERQIAMECGVSIAVQRKRLPTPKEEVRIQDLVARTAKRPLYFLKGHLTMANIEAQAYRLKETERLDLVLVDYVQLLSDTVSGDSIREKVGLISRSLKRLARDCECPCVVASQLNRNVEARADKRPILADLKETGDLEQDADLVLLLHRPEMFEPGKEAGVCRVYIAKQRQGGKVGKVDLRWNAKASRYYDPKDGEQMEAEL
jgi:replicative DNA helicase